MLPFNSGIKAWDFLFSAPSPLQVAEGKLEILSFNRWIFYTGKTESMNFYGQKRLVRSCLRNDSTSFLHLLFVSAD